MAKIRHQDHFVQNLRKLNNNYSVKTGKKWQDRRKIMTPAFHFKILEEFITVFDRVGNTFIERLRKRDTNEYIELYPLAGLYALDVMCGEFLRKILILVDSIEQFFNVNQINYH